MFIQFTVLRLYTDEASEVTGSRLGRNWTGSTQIFPVHRAQSSSYLEHRSKIMTQLKDATDLMVI